MNYSLPLALCLLIMAATASAQSSDEDARIQELSWMDRNHMQQQRDSIENLAQTRLGKPVRGDKSDLETLQQIIDRGLIERDDTLRLQALGAILGDVMAQEVPELQWKVYEDEKGRSRALCVEDAGECLFPVTMLSRRIKVGLNPDVNKVYREALELMEPYLPEKPYTGTDYR